MNHRTHRNWAKLFSPGTSWKVIDDINSIIDNPNEQAVAFSNLFQTKIPDPNNPGKMVHYNPFDVFGLGKSGGHRRVNHDPMSAAAMSFMRHGMKGVELGNLHVMMDVISERMKEKHGVTGRDLWEAHTNHLMENYVLPPVLQKQRVLNQIASASMNNIRRRSHSGGRLRNRVARQNVHKPFIPTKAFYY